MRDLLSKLDTILTESALNPNDPKGDYKAKSKALQDLQLDPVAADDPEISQAIVQRKADLEKEAKSLGIDVKSEEFEVGDDFGISFSEDFEIETSIVSLAEDGIVIELDDHSLEFLESNGFSFDEGELVEGVAGPQSCWKGYRKVGTKPGTGKNAGKRVNDCEKIGEELDEYFTFDTKPGKDRGPRDHGTDELERRSKLGKNPLVKHGKEYKDKDKYGGYKIAGPKGKLPEDSDIELEAKYHGKEVPLGKKLPGDVKKSKVYVRKPNGKIVKVNFGDKKMRIKKSNPARRKSFRARHNCKNPGPRWKARYWSCRSW